MSSNIDWNDTIKKEAEGINGEDFGEVQDVSNGSVLVQRGIIKKEKFLIPQELVESYDGDIVRFRISEDDMLSKYREGDSVAASESVETETTQDIVQSEEKIEETIPLTEERLEVSKNLQEQQATITKKPVTETKTVEVPVTHEEVTIERRAPSGGEGQVASEGPVTSSEEINIPLKKEEVEVNKTPYVKEEVAVTKKPVTQTRQVTEEVTSERISTEDSQ
jgi:uncharacterized protein (TIGR02271 family)